MSADQKKKIRKSIEAQLNALSFAALIEKSHNLKDQFEQNIFHIGQPYFADQFVVSFYPFDTEPQINLEVFGLNLGYVRIIDWNASKMESAEARRDLPGQWEDISPQKDVLIYQPMASQPALLPHQISAILVPGVGFDRECRRLGRGKGFYDHYLKQIPEALRIGVAFHEQITSQIPEDPWDERLDVILTDRECIETEHFSSWKKHGRVKR